MAETPKNGGRKARRKSLIQGDGGAEGGEGSAKDSPNAPTIQVGTLEARQRAFSLKVANHKGTIKQKLPSAYGQLVEDFKEWREKRPEVLKGLVMGKNKQKNGEELVKDRVKGLKEAGSCLTKLLESNPENRKDIHEKLMSQITKKGRVESGKITKHGFLELATFITGEEVKDPRKVTQSELVELISHGINFVKPRLCYLCEFIEEPGRPSSYKGLKCSMCGYSVCKACNLS